jgi:tyrosyl-tRNA synthetase
LSSDGSKLGKTETGTIWLDAGRTSPYQLYQYFVRTDDRLVTTYLRYFTWLDHDRVRDLDRLTTDFPERREAQHVLAKEVTSLVHGDGDAARAVRATRALFEGELDELDEALFRDVFADAPSHATARGRLDDGGVNVVDLAQESGLEPSKSAARRRVQEGGLYVNNAPAEDTERCVTRADLLHDRWVVLRKGKHQYLVVEFR